VSFDGLQKVKIEEKWKLMAYRSWWLLDRGIWLQNLVLWFLEGFRFCYEQCRDLGMVKNKRGWGFNQGRKSEVLIWPFPDWKWEVSIWKRRVWIWILERVKKRNVLWNVKKFFWNVNKRSWGCFFVFILYILAI